MRHLMLSLVLVVPTVASAGEIALTRSGGFGGLWIRIDGGEPAKVSKRESLTVEVEDGRHEIWVSTDRDGISTLCHGTVDVQGAFQWDVRPMQGACSVLTDEVPEHTAWKGAWLTVKDSDTEAVAHQIEIDGNLVDSPETTTYNLTPGPHAVRVVAGLGDEARQICFGMVTIPPGETRMLMVTSTSCAGYDNEVRLAH